MQTVLAEWFHQGRLKPVRLIVIHCTVSPEQGTGAEAVAAYFARGERRASAHRVVDNNSTVICVRDEDTAFGAAGANSDGLHLELVGLPTQSSVQWQDPYSLAEFGQAAATIREWSAEFHVPLRWLTVDQVADGKTMGLCTHADVSKAFPAVSTGHWDPGPEFPKAEALRIWTPTPVIAPSEGDMYFLKIKGTPEVWFFETGRYTHVPTSADGNAVAKAAGIAYAPTEVSETFFNRLASGRTRSL